MLPVGGSKPPVQKATACDNCYTSKRKCDGGIPRCSVCKKTRAECTYVRRFVSPSLIRRPRKEHEEEINTKLAKQLERKLSQVEKTVKGIFKGLANEQSVQSTDHPPRPLERACSSNLSLPVTPDTTQSLSPPQLHIPLPPFADMTQQPYGHMPHREGANTKFFSTEELLLDFAFPATSRFAMSQENPELNERFLNELEDAFSMSLDTVGDNEGPSVPQISQDQGPIFFISNEERDELIKVFFDITRRVSIYITPLPIVHEGQFWRRLASDKPPGQSLVLAMCSLAAASGPSADGSRWPYHSFVDSNAVARSDEILAAALASLNIEKPSIDSCQALVIMVWHCAIVAPLRLSQEWLLAGMALRMVSLLKLDIDPDDLEADDPSGRKWTWLEKETRRRLFALMRAVDQIDLIFREVSFGLWKRKTNVKQPSTYAVWLSVNPDTEEPTVDPRNLPPSDAGLMCLRIADLCCRVTEFNLARGITYNATVYTPTQTHANANPLVPSNPKIPEPNPSTITPSPATEDTMALDQRFALINNDLTAFLRDLPIELSSESINNSTVFRTRYDWAPTGPPLYQGIRVHLWFNASVIVLHRPRMIQAIAQVAASIPIAMAKAAVAQSQGHLTNPAYAGGIDWVFLRQVWGPSGGAESLSRCLHSAITITRILLKTIHIVPPSFLLTSKPTPVGAFCAVNESRAVLEAGLHHLVMVVLLSGLYGLGPPPDDLYGVAAPSAPASAPIVPTSEPLKPAPPVMTVPRPISILVEEVLGKRAVKDAREGLAVALGVLQDIAVRRPRVKVMSEMLNRLIDAAGITGIVPVQLGGAAGGSD